MRPGVGLESVDVDVLFATTNISKFREAKPIFLSHGLKIRRLNFKAKEIQSDNLREISKSSLLHVLEKYKAPVIVEDAGLFIEALKGFPGPYSAFVYRKISVEGILKLMDNIQHRQAYFLSAVAYGSPDRRPLMFTGKVDGLISYEKRGMRGFGFDPIFKPMNQSKTFGEMTLPVKNQHSHRAAALRKAAKWLASSKFNG